MLVIAGRVAEHWARGAPSESAGASWPRLSGGDPAVNESILTRRGPRLAQGASGDS